MSIFKSSAVISSIYLYRSPMGSMMCFSIAFRYPSMVFGLTVADFILSHFSQYSLTVGLFLRKIASAIALEATCALGEGHRVLLLGENVVAVGADFLDIVAAKGNIAPERGLSVFAKGQNLNETVRRNDSTVCCGEFLYGIEAEGHSRKLVIYADTVRLPCTVWRGREQEQDLQRCVWLGSFFCCRNP